jgi:calcineurin-like phosphoesterase family protein
MNKIFRFKQTDDTKVYFHSDWHYNHAPRWDVPIWKQRGYNSVEEMNVDIIKNVNETIRAQDILIYLGDISLNCAEDQFERFISQINCQNIYTLFGNHNSPVWTIYRREIGRWLEKNYNHGLDQIGEPYILNQESDTEIYPFKYKNIIFIGNYAEFIVDGQHIVASHYPFMIWNKMSSQTWCLVGHSHGGCSNTNTQNKYGRILDVGYDEHKKPLSFYEIKSIMDSKKFIPIDRHHI